MTNDEGNLRAKLQTLKCSPDCRVCATGTIAELLTHLHIVGEEGLHPCLIVCRREDGLVNTIALDGVDVRALLLGLLDAQDEEDEEEFTGLKH